MGLEDKRVMYSVEVGTIKIPKETGIAHRLLDVFINQSQLSEGCYMDITVGTRGITRIPLYTGNFNLMGSPAEVSDKGSVMALIRKLFGEDVFVEADEDEDITIIVKDKAGTLIDISYFAVAYYQNLPAGIDKTLLMRSGSENFVIAPFIWHEESVTADNATVDTSKPLDNVIQMEGLPEIEDSYVVPAALEFELKAVILDSIMTSAGTVDFAKAWLHFKDLTFELFSPVKYLGIKAENKVKNIASFNIATFRYLDGENYVFRGGHELTMIGDFKGGGTGTAITTTIRINFVPILLMRKVA